MPIFEERRQAGRRLAGALSTRRDLAAPLVLAMPRGGVPVGYEVAVALKAPLDLVFVRKIGAPGQPDIALGAVVDGASPRTVWNEEALRVLSPSKAYLEAEVTRQLDEIARQRRSYGPAGGPVPLEGRSVIVVDDGVATGASAEAVLKALSAAGPARRILAVPVGPTEALERLEAFADDVVCLEVPAPFLSVGRHYRDFSQTSDEDVKALLKEAAAREACAS